MLLEKLESKLFHVYIRSFLQVYTYVLEKRLALSW